MVPVQSAVICSQFVPKRLGDYILEHYGGKTDMRYALSYGCLILRDNTGPGWMMWAWNRVILPLCNLDGHGDVRAYRLCEV